MSTVLTGAATDPTTSPTATCPADTDIGNAASVNGAFQSILNFIGWVRQKMGRLDAANAWSAFQSFNAGLSAQATGASAVTGTAVTSGDGVHGTGAGANAGVAGYGGASAGAGGNFVGGANGPGVVAAPGAGAVNAIEASGHISAGGHLLIDIATPASSTDGATKGYVDSGASYPLTWVGPTIAPNYSSPDAAFQYTKDRLGFVHLHGTLAWIAGTNGSQILLPAGFRPSTYRKFPVYANLGTTFEWVVVGPDGSITFSSNGTANDATHYRYFDSVYFLAEQ